MVRIRRQTEGFTNVVKFGEEDLSYRQKDTISDGEDECSKDVELHGLFQQFDSALHQEEAHDRVFPLHNPILPNKRTKLNPKQRFPHFRASEVKGIIS